MQSRPDGAQEAGAAGRVATRGDEIDKIETATLVQLADRGLGARDAV